jgi:amidase
MSVTASDLWRMSATDQAAAIRSRQVSSQEVIKAHLRRIEDVNLPSTPSTPSPSS